MALIGVCVCVCVAHWGLEDGYVVVNLGTVPLGNALGDPDNVSTLLLLELDVGVEDAEVELV